MDRSGSNFTLNCPTLRKHEGRSAVWRLGTSTFAVEIHLPSGDIASGTVGYPINGRGGHKQAAFCVDERCPSRRAHRRRR